MAGESPGKVERRESSGETTDDGGTVASTGVPDGVQEDAKGSGPEPERKSADSADERSGGADSGTGETEAESGGSAGGEAPGESGGRGDARLKAAVAAWVGREDDEEDGDGPEEGSAPDGAGPAGPDAAEGGDDEGAAESADAGDVKPGTSDSASGEGNSSQTPESDLPVRPKTGEGKTRAVPRPAEATAMFRTVRRDQDEYDAEKDSEEAAKRAEQMTSAFFGSAKSSVKQDSAGDAGSPDADASGPAGTADAEKGSGKGAGKGLGGGSAKGAGSGSGKGAGKRAAKGADTSDEESAKGAETGSAKGPRKGSAKGSGKPGGGRPERRDVDQETTALVVGKQADRRGVDQETTALAVGKVDKAGGAGKTGRAGTAGKADAKGTAKDSAKGPTKGAAETGGSQGGGTKEGAPGKASSGAVDQATTAFRTVAPAERGTSDEDRTSGKGGKGARTGKGAGTGEGAGAEAKAEAPATTPRDPRLPADDEPGSASASDSAEPETGKDAKTGKDARDGKDAEKAPDKGADKAPDKAPAKGDGKAPGKAPGKADGTSADGDGTPASKPESDSERTSQFVALRDADAPPRPKRAPGVPAAPPKPLGKPRVGPELPPEVEETGALPQLSEAERTRQEPRPDQAPLDLLAQLTNTPPPPETPLRNAVRRVKIYTPLAVVLLILFVIAQALRPLPEPELTLSAAPTHTFDGAKPSVPWPSEGQAALDVQGLGSFGTYGKQKPVPIASVAKVMTAYVILRDHPVKKGSDGPRIPVDKKAQKEAGLSSQNESTVKVKAGDTLTEREAVQAVMIASANNVARLLARWDAGSEKKFVAKMNDAAADLGMKDTKYTDPSGLTASTVSTAVDQVKLAKKAMGIDLFRETVRLPGYKDSKGEEHGNWNKLVPLDGVVGVKTGTTTKAGGNLVFAAEQQVGDTEQLIVGAVLGQYRPSILDTVLGESKKLIDAAQDELTTERVVRKGEVVGYVDDQLGGRTPVVASRDVSAVGWSGLKVKLALSDGGKLLPHEGKAGDRAGTLTVGDGPGQVRVPVLLKDDKTEPGFGAKLTRIL